MPTRKRKGKASPANTPSPRSADRHREPPGLQMHGTELLIGQHARDRSGGR